jgi:lipopolysaccharide export system ATP-binding protein
MLKLTIDAISKSYHARPIVKSVSFSLTAGKVLGLLGPNGAGKTTCFYMIVGLVRSDQGQVLLGEHDITHLPMHHRAKLGLGYLPQEASVFRKLSVRDNILAILEMRKELRKSEREEKLQTLIQDFHLEKVQDTLGISLSGGERRRVEIARALACDPKFILLDEPFAGVDPISVYDIKAQIKLLTNRGIGVLITDHNVRETLAICDSAVIMNGGTVIASGIPDYVLNHPEVRAVYLGDQFQL